MSRYLGLFVAEASEHLEALGRDLVALEGTPAAETVRVIATDTEDAYADYIDRSVIETFYPEEFTLALTYLLASYLATSFVKGKTGLGLQAQMLAAYNLVKKEFRANEQDQRQITERYKTQRPGWISNR